MRPCLMRQRLCPAASFPGRSRAVVPGPAFARQSVHIRTATSSAAALVDDYGGSAVLSFKADRSSFPEGLPDLVRRTHAADIRCRCHNGKLARHSTGTPSIVAGVS